MISAFCVSSRGVRHSLVADDEESRTALKTLEARFSDFRSDSDRTIGVQDSDLSRDCGIVMTA